jgi:hypothetical protein
MRLPEVHVVFSNGVLSAVGDRVQGISGTFDYEAT